MPHHNRTTTSLFCALFLLTPGAARAQGAASGKWYVSWGYNTETYADPGIRFEQPGLGNDFTLHNVQMEDRPDWDFWNHSLTIPQYSIRIGRFIRKNTAIELNFDHAKAILTTNRTARLTGTLAGVAVDSEVLVSDFVQTYKLNNGANFLLVNVVQRFPLLGVPGHTGSVALLGKAGIGIMIPHTENTVLGQPNQSGFEFGGFGTGLEAALRVHVFRGLYVEGAEKGFYGRYRNLNINQGTASQDIWAYMSIVSMGFAWGHLGP
jgi:hypothetical protein